MVELFLKVLNFVKFKYMSASESMKAQVRFKGVMQLSINCWVRVKQVTFFLFFSCWEHVLLTISRCTCIKQFFYYENKLSTNYILKIHEMTYMPHIICYIRPLAILLHDEVEVENHFFNLCHLHKRSHNLCCGEYDDDAMMTLQISPEKKVECRPNTYLLLNCM